MKMEYKKPKIDVQLYMAESSLLSSTHPNTVNISGGGFPSIEGPITEVDDEGGEPSGAKGGDFFEESISPRSLWGDDEE